jgi:hypothetical protein
MLLQIPVQVTSVKLYKIHLQGITAKDDSSLTHLSPRIIVDHFKDWVKRQRELHGRMIFSVATSIVDICAIPKNVQTISRKLRVAPLIFAMSRFTEDPPFLFDPNGLLEIPSCMKSMAPFSFDLSPKALLAILEDIPSDVKSLALPQQLVEYARSYFQPPVDGFRISNSIPGSALMKLPSGLTKLVFSEKFLLESQNCSFPNLEHLTELKVASQSMASMLWSSPWGLHFPSLQKLSLMFLPRLNQIGLDDLPPTLKEFTLLANHQIPMYDPDDFEAHSDFFVCLPRGLLSLSILHPCVMSVEEISALPENLTAFYFNSAQLDAEHIKVLPKGIISFKQISRKVLCLDEKASLRAERW